VPARPARPRPRCRRSLRAAFLLFALSLTGTCSLPTRPAGIRVEVVRVIDGDTVVLTDDRRVRLLGLDAPELASGGSGAQCFASESAAFLTLTIARCEGRVRLETDRVACDRYGRTLAYLWDERGNMLNEVILREGYAVFMQGDAERWAERLAAAEAEARANRRGLWHPEACGGSPRQVRPGLATRSEQVSYRTGLRPRLSPSFSAVTVMWPLGGMVFK